MNAMFFQTFFSFVFEFKTHLIGLFIGFVFYKLFRFYQSVRTYPPGPLPLPLIGNILSKLWLKYVFVVSLISYFKVIFAIHFSVFRSKDTWDKVLRRVANKYGPVFTIWLGNKPIVVISDIDIGRDVFSKLEFSGRPDIHLRDY